MREIRTSGSEGRGWKRAYGSRTEHHRESEWTTHRTLRAPRHLLTLPRGWAPPRPTIAAEWKLGGIAEGRATSDGTVTRVALLPRFLWDAIPGGGIAFADSSSYAIKLTGPSGDVVRDPASRASVATRHQRSPTGVPPPRA